MCHGPAIKVRGQSAAVDSLPLPHGSQESNRLYLLSGTPAPLLALTMPLALGLPRMMKFLLLVFMKTVAALVVVADGVSVGGDGDAAGAC